ncbi:MAG: DUF4080 domain-containing protein [Desulfobacterales bacterium]|nr:DUF4080 domain-containing protein [Desulfobacterales bacterium]
MKVKAVGINARFTHSCLALFYIRHELEKNIPEAHVEICQYTINDPYYTTIQRLADGDPDLIFFSALIWNSDLVERLVEDLLIMSDSFHLVIGGPQAEIVGSHFAFSKRVTVFVGNIEVAGGLFFEDLQKRRLQKQYNASFLKTPKKQLDFPYRPEDFAEGLKNRHIYYESSRGCPFSCTYCLSSSEKGLFHKPLDQVFAELLAILSHRPKVVRFLDRTFNDKPERALAIWEFLRNNGEQTLFHFEIAPDRFSEEMFSFLRTVLPGRFQFEIGIQSTNPDTLSAINRPIDPGLTKRTVARLRAMENIHLHVDLILGLPFDTVETFYRSFNDVFGMQPHYIQMGLLKLLPDTIIKQTAKDDGYLASTSPPYAIFASRWLSAADVRQLYWFCECVEKFINNRYFMMFWQHMAQADNDMAAFFMELTDRFAKPGYLWMAATQETLSSFLYDLADTLDDVKRARELLIFDWLRCGHRFLPDHLKDQYSGNDLRRLLYQKLPAEIPDLYTKSGRATFLKTSVFHLFSREVLDYLGHQVESEQGIVCFLQKRERSVNRLNQIKVLSSYDD